MGGQTALKPHLLHTHLRHSKQTLSCEPGCEPWVWKLIDASRLAEGKGTLNRPNTEAFDNDLGRAVEANATGIQAIIFTWTENTKQLETNRCSYERQLFTSENEHCLRMLFANRAVGTVSGKQQHNSWCPFCLRSHGGVTTCTVMQQTKPLSIFQSLHVERPQRHTLNKWNTPVKPVWFVECLVQIAKKQLAWKSWTNTRANAA